MRRALAATLAAAVAAAGGACKKREAPRGKAMKVAVLTTSMGVIRARLFTAQAPKTTAHFAALAAGTKKWRDPRDGKEKSSPLYDGVPFHRVVPGFMIQTGDPLGDGRGDIGVVLPDEFHPKLRYDKPGRLGLANNGPDTNGGQFFITLAPASDLDDRHPLFGQVIEGLDVVKAISRVPRDERESSNRPLEPVILRSVRIVEEKE